MPSYKSVSEVCDLQFAQQLWNNVILDNFSLIWWDWHILSSYEKQYFIGPFTPWHFQVYILPRATSSRGSRGNWKKEGTLKPLCQWPDPEDGRDPVPSRKEGVISQHSNCRAHTLQKNRPGFSSGSGLCFSHCCPAERGKCLPLSPNFSVCEDAADLPGSPP